MADCFMVYITTANRDEAFLIGEEIVKERLAACVNVQGSIESIYWWEGHLRSDEEVALIAKTSAGQVDRLIARVKELHSYDCPCIVALAIEKGHGPFLEWIETETAVS